MIVDVSEQDFKSAVIDRSQDVPVVVDFWAEWCGPCRQLTPMLEKATKKRDGEVVLAKVDTDANPRLRDAFRIQGIPAVKAFRNGKIVSQFTGVIPPDQVEKFFDQLVPRESDLLVAKGDEESLRRALDLEPGKEAAAIPLAKLLLARGDTEEALTIVNRVAGSFRADGIAARIRLVGAAEGDELDTLTRAFAAIDDGRHEEGLDLLIEEIRVEPTQDRKDELRRAVVGVLDELGVDDALARETRRKLAKALF